METPFADALLAELGLRDLVEETQRALRASVVAARAEGCSWEAIAEAAGLTVAETRELAGEGDVGT